MAFTQEVMPFVYNIGESILLFSGSITGFWYYKFLKSLAMINSLLMVSVDEQASLIL